MILHCYIQGYSTDFYDLFTVLPNFIEKNNVNNVKFWVDSAYFHDELLEERQTVIDLMNKFGGDYTVIPKECGSYNKLNYKNDFKYEDIKNTFMPNRKPLTQSYMRSRIKYGDLFIHTVLGIDNTYQWLDSVNIPLLEMSHEETFRNFQLLQQHQRENS